MRAPRTLGAVVASTFLGSALVAGATPALADEPGETVVINVMSDVQGDLADFDTVLGEYASFPAADHMVVNGDIVPNGHASEYEAFLDVLDGHEHPPASYSIGNHEFYTGASSETHVARFLEYTRMPGVHHTVDVGGVPVVHIGSLRNPGTWAVGNQVVLGEEQLAWLDAELDRLPADRPVLVFGHHPLPDAVSATIGEGKQDYYDLDYAESEELLDILGGHPNVAFFSGHTHYNLDRADWMNRVVVEGGDPAGFLAVNTGAVQTEWGPEPGGPNRGEWAGSTDHKQALRLRVEGGELVVTSLDFRTREVVREVAVDMEGDYQPVERERPDWPAEQDPDPVGPTPEPGAVGTLEANRSEVRAPRAVVFSYTTNMRDRQNWIGVYPAGVLPGERPSLKWKYTPRAEGTVAFSTLGLAPGDYTAYLLHDDGYTTLADAAPFTVVRR